MTALTTIEVAILAACVVLAALASATETALTSINRLRVRFLVEEGTPKAAILRRLQEDPSRFLSTVLVTNTFALVVASSMATLLGGAYLPHSWGFYGDLGVSFLLAIFILIVAEVTPKTFAIRHAEVVALAASRPVDFLASLLSPLLWFITFMARAFSGGRVARGPYLTEQELMTILHVSEEQGVIEEEERDMIHGIIQIGDKLVREVMVPRTDITAIERGASPDELNELIRNHGHTRVPVYEGDIDHMVGLIHAKDVLLHYMRGESFDINRMLRPIRFTPEQKKVDELLHEMQREKVHMMVVVDEYGGTAGLVTLEDLLEEIVGEIRDEYDVAEEEPLSVVSDHEALVDARYPMDELNEKLNLGITESEEYDSVGGYLYSVLGTIPEAGTSFEGEQIVWTVEAVNGQRIIEVRLTSKKPWPREVLVEAGLPIPEPEQAASAEGATG
jgi:CBS domain containing-hemolysin-like protein